MYQAVALSSTLAPTDTDSALQPSRDQVVVRPENVNTLQCFSVQRSEMRDVARKQMGSARLDRSGENRSILRRKADSGGEINSARVVNDAHVLNRPE